jgi:uncharacterized protein (DUF1015 family)
MGCVYQSFVGHEDNGAVRCRLMSCVRIYPFAGLIPQDSHVEQVNCVPYDVINEQEARGMVQGNPYSLLHVDRAEVDLPEGIDVYSDAVYAKAKENFEKLKRDGVLIKELAPCLYLYRQVMGNHSQVGLVALCDVEDYRNDIIKKHEKTRPDKENDRTRLIDTIGVQTGPIFVAYQGTDEVDQLVKNHVQTEPLFDVTAPDGIRHTLWRTLDSEAYAKAFQKIPCAYIADGHHRAASAARVAQLRKERDAKPGGEKSYDKFLCVLFPASQLKILPYHRCVADLNGLSADEFLKKTSEVFSVKPTDQANSPGAGIVQMYVQGKWYSLELPKTQAMDPVSSLDVSILQDHLLKPVLGIDDPRTSHRIEFIGGIRGAGELVKKVDSGNAAVAFSMYPTTVQEMMAIADAGQIMPPKSTWFEPKLRSGFFIHTFD